MTLEWWFAEVRTSTADKYINSSFTPPTRTRQNSLVFSPTVFKPPTQTRQDSVVLSMSTVWTSYNTYDTHTTVMQSRDSRFTQDVQHLHCLLLKGTSPANARIQLCSFSLLWPWPWPDDLDIRIWPRYSEDVPAYWKWNFYAKAVKSCKHKSNRQTWRDQMHYLVVIISRTHCMEWHGKGFKAAHRDCVNITYHIIKIFYGAAPSVLSGTSHNVQR